MHGDLTDTALLRRFNRAWTQRIGVLDDSFLGSGRSLAPSRLLFEIAQDGAAVLDLRRRLGLDSGYLSRLLRQLEDEGLVRVEADPVDRRRRVVTLTAEGKLAWQDLEDRSETLARRLVAPLGPSARARLEAALATAERLIRAATVDFEIVDPASPAAQQAVSAYYMELDRRFPGGFDPGDALTADAAALREPTGVFVLASSDGEPVACGGVWKNAPDIAEIKRMWVDDQWRGAGLGSRLLSRLESEARRLGYSSVRLDTNPTLSEAIAMYGRAGYRPVERYNDNPYAGAWFAKTLAG